MSEQHENPLDEHAAIKSVDSEHLEPILKTPTPGHIPVLRQLGLALLLLAGVFGTTYVSTLITLFSPNSGDSDVRVTARLIDESLLDTPQVNPFDDVMLTAESAFVWDVKNKRVLFSKNPDDIRPLASITKLMTALVAYELLDDGETLLITNEAVKTDGDSGLKEGEIFSLGDLSNLTLISSSNDGAMALGAKAGASIGTGADPEVLFVKAMNFRAGQLGLSNTLFKNPTGLDLSPTEAGAYSSARDVAHLLEYIITTYPHVTSLTTEAETRITNTHGEYHEVANTNPTVSSIPGLIASKTGYTELAGGNLAVAFESGLNHPVIVVVLGSGYEERFSDVLLLSERAREYISHGIE
jgi:D-alanyl-D-alanine carboxypeptidase